MTSAINPFGHMTNAYKDSTFLITKHVYLNDSLIEIANTDISVPNSSLAQFIVFRKGRVVGYDLEGNVVVARNAGDTSDTSAVVIPERGVLSIDANSEFYCIMKTDNSSVDREVLSLHGKMKSIVKKSGVLCVMEGNINVNDTNVVAPAFVKLSETDCITYNGCDSWIILVN